MIRIPTILLPYLALSGGFAVILGYTAQNTIGQLFAGLSLNLGNNLRKGDYILVGNHEGIIHDMDWRSVTIISDDSKELIVVPNAEFAHSTFINRTRLNKKVNAVCNFQISGYYQLDLVMSLLREAIIDFGLTENNYLQYYTL